MCSAASSPRPYDFMPTSLLADVGRRMITAFVRRAASEVPAGSLVLDAAAGEAAYRSLFSHCRYVAIDLGIGDPRWSYRGIDAFADLVQMPFSQGSFDAVLLTEVLEHSFEPLAVLKECRQVLRHGGTLFITVPMAHELHQEPHDYFRYTSHALDRLLRESGFVSIRVEPMGGLFTRWAYELPRVLDTLPGSGLLRGSLSARGLLLFPLRMFFRLILRPMQRLLLFLERFDSAKRDPLGWTVVAR